MCYQFKYSLHLRNISSCTCRQVRRILRLHMETETKRPPFRRRHFQTHFLECECYNFHGNVTEFFPKHPINNIQALAQTMVWRRLGNRALSEAMAFRLLIHICVARPQLVNATKNHTTYCILHGRYFVIARYYLRISKWIVMCTYWSPPVREQENQWLYRGATISVLQLISGTL